MAPILREYRPADFEELYQLDQICYAPGIAYSRRMMREYLELPGALCLVAAEEADVAANAAAGKIIGFILAEFEATEAHIITLDVSPEAQRRKIGTQLYIAMEEELARRGVREMLLETATDNAAGVAFWQRHGYRTAGVIRNYYLRGKHAYAMWKEIHADSAAEAAREH
jgi:[ribosomal protein S18]-alanine N-acetyltransferase